MIAFILSDRYAKVLLVDYSMFPLKHLIFWSEGLAASSDWKGPLFALMHAALPQPTPAQVHSYRYYRGYFGRFVLLIKVFLFIEKLFFVREISFFSIWPLK